MQVGGWVWEGGGLRSVSAVRRTAFLAHHEAELRERQELELRVGWCSIQPLCLPRNAAADGWVIVPTVHVLAVHLTLAFG